MRSDTMIREIVPTWTLGDRLRKSRNLAGLDQEQMAKDCGVAGSTVSKWEHGDRKPRPGDLIVWSQRCGVPLWWLKGESEPDPGDSEPVTPGVEAQVIEMYPAQIVGPKAA